MQLRSKFSIFIDFITAINMSKVFEKKNKVLYKYTKNSFKVIATMLVSMQTISSGKAPKNLKRSVAYGRYWIAQFQSPDILIFDKPVY